MPLGEDIEDREDLDNQDEQRSSRKKKPYIKVDKRYRKRAKEMLRCAADEAFSDTPRRHRVKQSFKTFRDTKIHHTDHHSFVELGLNAVAGTVIAIATLPLAGVPWIAWAVTSLLTGASGSGIGFGIERRRNSKARRKLRSSLSATAKGKSYEVLENEAVASLEATRRHYETLMLTERFFGGHREMYVRELYKHARKWHEELEPAGGDGLDRSSRDFYDAAFTIARKQMTPAGKKSAKAVDQRKKKAKKARKEAVKLRTQADKSNKPEDERKANAAEAEAERLEGEVYAGSSKSLSEAFRDVRRTNQDPLYLMQRGERLALRKTTYYCAQLNNHVQLHCNFINDCAADLINNVEKLLPLVEPQSHLTGNHNCDEYCCISEQDRLDLKDDIRNRGHRSSRELVETPKITEDFIAIVLDDVKLVLSKVKDEEDARQTRRDRNATTRGTKRWAATDAVVETEVGIGISSLFGDTAAAAIGSASTGGIAGAFLGKVFSFLGTHYTVNIPALKEIAYVAQAPMNEKPLRMKFAKGVETDRLQYALGKLYHYHKKYCGYIEKIKQKHEEVSSRPGRGSKWHDCAEAYRFLTMFFYCAKTLMKYEAHCHFLECFVDGHAELIAERSIPILEDTATNLEDWHAYWGGK